MQLKSKWNGKKESVERKRHLCKQGFGLLLRTKVINVYHLIAEFISKDVQFNESKIHYRTLFSSNPNPIIADQSNPTPLTVLPTIPASSVVSQPYPYPLLLYNSSNLLIIPHLNLAFLLLPQLLMFHRCSPLHLHSLWSCYPHFSKLTTWPFIPNSWTFTTCCPTSTLLI